MTKEPKSVRVQRVPGRPRVRTVSFIMRLTVEEDEMFREAAQGCGLDVSSWIRERAIAAAKKEMAE